MLNSPLSIIKTYYFMEFNQFNPLKILDETTMESWDSTVVAWAAHLLEYPAGDLESRQ